ncbi:unnamed protein product [Eruca vesicaria subsp. sativa]|uniref:Uncharacterized protein n=1 Tax=Eruca vesicaria subsp. sativa TaxID=29727 RepID=A0ABC8KCD7_ERUVS|nr:unnamed protein product [Eruca vesicaria subsp. sativa]
MSALTWNALRFAFLLLLFHVGFPIVLASSLFVLLNWFLAQSGLVPVETQMQELNLAPTDKSN